MDLVLLLLAGGVTGVRRFDVEGHKVGALVQKAQCVVVILAVSAHAEGQIDHVGPAAREGDGVLPQFDVLLPEGAELPV